MKRHDQDKLLNELLAGAETAEFRNASLAHALKAMRRDQRRKRALRGGALVLAVGLLGAFMWLNSRPGGVSSLPNQVATNPADLPRSEPKPPPIKYISDDELFALFPNRAMALIGKPGRQQLVFLDSKLQDADQR